MVHNHLPRGTRVLHVAWLKAEYGGAHKYLDRLVQRLLDAECEITIVVNQQELERPFLGRLEQSGVRVDQVPLEESETDAAIEIDRLIAEARPHIVHFNSGAKQPRRAAMQMRAWDERNFRSVFTMHLPLVGHSPTLSEQVAQYLPVTTAYERFRERKSFARRFNKIISVSERFARINVNALKLREEQVVFVPNGVDVTRFEVDTERRDGDANDPSIVVGGCGGLVPQKRFDLLVEALAKIADLPVQVKIAGEGPERAAIEAKVKKLGLTQRVDLLGHQDNVVDFLNSIDIFAMPSDYEAFPYSELEAMAVALPSVVTDVGDLPYMVRDGREGMVVPPGDADSFAAALRSLVEDAERRRQMGRSARKRVVECYEQVACESQTIDIFRELLEG